MRCNAYLRFNSVLVASPLYVKTRRFYRRRNGVSTAFCLLNTLSIVSIRAICIKQQSLLTVDKPCQYKERGFAHDSLVQKRMDVRNSRSSLNVHTKRRRCLLARASIHHIGVTYCTCLEATIALHQTVEHLCRNLRNFVYPDRPSSASSVVFQL